jgi:hypothetical protein
MAVTKDGKPKRAADYEAEEKKARVNKALAIRAKLDPGPEGDVARDMLAKRNGTDVLDGERLDVIATDIKAEYGKGIDAQFAIGRLLNEAAELFPVHGGGVVGGSRGGSHSPFGDWFRAQGFGFNLVTAWRLREAAKREPEVRAFISSRSAVNGSKEVGVTTAITELNAKPVEPTQTAVAKQARKDLKEALHSEDDIPEVVAWLSATDTLIAFTDAVPVAELKAIGEKAQALIAWFNQQKEQRA